MKESRWQTKLIHRLRETGAKTFNVHGHEMQESGWPDVQVYSRIWTGHLELKIRNRPATLLQRRHLLQLCERGTPGYLLRIHEDVFNVHGPREEELGNIDSTCDGKEFLQFLRDVDQFAMEVGVLWNRNLRVSG